MAGDWIKMRGNLWDDPRVCKICDMTGGTEAAVIGALYWLWASADQHTENGIMPGLTSASIDRKVGLKGFAAALVAVSWLADHPEGVRILHFEEHNGASAKRRLEDSKRKANVRKVSDKTRTDAGLPADNSGTNTELEKEIEIEKRDREIPIPSVPYGTGGKPPTPAERVWANGIPLLTAAGVKESNARSMLGGLCKTHGPDAVADAIQRCAQEGAIAPVAWLQAALRVSPKVNAQEALEAANRAVAARFLENDSHAHN